MYGHTYIHTYLRTYVRTYARTCMQYVQYIHMYIYICIHMYIHVYGVLSRVAVIGLPVRALSNGDHCKTHSTRSTAPPQSYCS